MRSEPSHEAVLTNTGSRISLHQCGRSVNTHVDGANPFNFLLRTECSPFFPYCRFCTGTWIWIIRTRHEYCGPKNSQSDGKNSVDDHIRTRRCVNGGTDSGSIYCPVDRQHRQKVWKTIV